MKKIIIVTSIILAVVVFALFGIKSVSKTNGSKNETNGGLTVMYKLAETTEVTESFKSSGVVDVLEREDIYAVSDGKIKEFLIEVGDTVNVGDVLFIYDEQYLEDLQDSLADAKLNLQISQTNLQGYRDNLNSINDPTVREIDLLPLESQVYNSQNAIEDYSNQLETIEENILDAEEDITKATEEYNKQKMLFDNGLISEKELESFADILKATEDTKENLDIQKESLQDNIERANYNLDIANKNLNFAKNPSSMKNEQQVNQAQNSITIGELNVEQAKSNVDKIQEKINEYTTSQISQVEGVVTDISVLKMTPITKGTKVLEITDVSNENYKVILNVEQKHNSKLKEGQDVLITSSALGDEVVNGKISKIMSDATISKNTTGTNTYIDSEVIFNESIKGLKSGFTVEGEVIVEKFDNAVVIPVLSVVIGEDDKKYVYVINDDNTVEKREVKLGVLDGAVVQVTNVQDSEKIATNNLKFIEDGDTVNPIEKE